MFRLKIALSKHLKKFISYFNKIFYTKKIKLLHLSSSLANLIEQKLQQVIEKKK